MRVCVSSLEQQIAISFFHNRRRRQLINCYFCAPPFPSPLSCTRLLFVGVERMRIGRVCVVASVVIVVIHCCWCLQLLLLL